MYFFRISLKNFMVYRWSIFFAIIGSIISIAINIFLWHFLYQNNSEMISYMTKYAIISSVISMFYSKGISKRLGDKVSDGSFVIDLLRPINLFITSWQIELANICSNLIFKGLPIIIIYMPLLFINKGYYNIFFVAFSILLGHILFILIYSLLGFLSFILIEIWPYERLIDDTIRLLAGKFIPFAILPAWINSISNMLPFKYLYSFPLELLFGDINGSIILQNFVILISWIIVFAVMNFIFYYLALNKTVIQGG